MKKSLKSYWPILALLILSGLVVWPLFMPGYFPQHDGLQIIRVFEMRKCFTDLQVPCRWVPDMGFGNGYPLFNYYGVLPYYIGAVASYLLGYIGATKLLYFLPLVLGGIGMYLLAKELFGKIPGFVSSVLFLFAPYRAVDAYVRGAIGEGFGINLIPFVFYFLLKLVKTNSKKYFVLATLTTALFFMSHNIMTLIFAPIIILWVLFWLWNEKWKGFKSVLLSLLVAFGLSAFFLLPAFFEKGLVRTDTLITGYYDFINHFAALFQLFTDRFWGYGGSVRGIGDQLSFQIGWPHWWLVVGAAFLALIKRNKNQGVAFLLLFIFGLSVFMIHGRSAFIWEIFKVLAFVQFPWRFLSIVIVSASLLGGYFVGNFKGRYLYILSALVVLTTIILNWSYFRPVVFDYALTDQKELTGQDWINQQGGAVLDYLPITALEPKELAPSTPVIIDGVGNISSFVNRSDSWKFHADISKNASVEVPVFDFPNWQVFIDNKEVRHSHNGRIGRIEITVLKGGHDIKGELKNTPLRTFANTLSILSLSGLALIVLWKKFRIS